MPIDWIALTTPVAQVLADGFDDLLAFVTYVEHVATAVTSRLTRADVHRRHSQVGALADAHAGVPHQAAGGVQKPQEIRGLHVLEKVDVLRSVQLARSEERR